jgi:hypothetical protein
MYHVHGKLHKRLTVGEGEGEVADSTQKHRQQDDPSHGEAVCNFW